MLTRKNKTANKAVKKCRIKCGDNVVLLAGKDKGRSGVVTRLFLRTKKFKADRLMAVVEGINMKKKHVKPNPNTNSEGGILEQEAAVDVSNIAFLNAQTNKADKVGYKVLENGKKVRITRSDNEVIDG
jgi:large subunit ribosomal protein L24